MRSYNLTNREKKYEVVYKTYADDIYKICLYYLKDTNHASDITQQIFLNFYEIFDEVHPDCTFGLLICEVKRLLKDGFKCEITSEEVKQCGTSGVKLLKRR